MKGRPASKPNLSPAAVARLQRRHAAGTSLASLARELGVARKTLQKRLRALPAVEAPPATTLPATKPVRMPHRLRPLPPRPVTPERSKAALRAELAEALARTARL